MRSYVGISRFDEVVETVEDLIVEEGMSAVTLRTIAARMRMSPSNINHLYTSKSRLLCLTANRLAIRRRDVYGGRAARGDLAGLLPVDESELRCESAWQGLREHGRADRDLNEVCTFAHGEMRHTVHAVTRHDLDDVRLDGLMSLMDGLWSAMTRPARPVSYEHAVAVLGLAGPLLLDGAPARTRPMPSWESWAAEFWVA